MKKLHLICNAHIDPVWQWEWEEGASATLSTFQSAANLAREFDYIFCHNEVSVYKYTEKYAPKLFEEIQTLVKQGKWHIMGGWFLQPDCLMPSGEGIIRQIREGEMYFREKFGVMPTVAVNFDPFGHSRGIVQIIKKCGQNGYLFMRPYGKYMPNPQLALPDECFWWEGYDGSRIKASRVTEYNSPLGGAAEKIKLDMERQRDAEVAISCWGVGNHGGGPSKKDLTDVNNMISASDVDIAHSTPERYFDDVNPTAVWANSLVPCMVGCYTSMSELKKKYRSLERRLFFAEKIASVAALKGAINYPEKELRIVTEDMMNVQFHDILPGDMIKAGEENGLAFIGHGMHILNGIRADAFFALCKGQPVAEEGTYPIMVFNPKPVAEKQLIECELSIIPTDEFEVNFSQIEIFDKSGKKLKAQTIKEGSNISIDWRKRIIFEATPDALAITRYTAKTVVKPRVKFNVVENDIVFQNDEKFVRISKDTGLIESYIVHGKEYATGQFFRPMIFDDTPDPWGMKEPLVGRNPQAFKLSQNPNGVFEGMKSLQIVEDGEIFLGVEAFFEWGLTRLRIGYRIYKDGSAIDAEVNLFPNEVSKAIKLCFDVGSGEYIGEQIFGTEKLFDDGRECIAHDFVAVKKGNEFLEIMTPDTFGSSRSDGTVAITLLKTATYCAHPVPNRQLLRDGMFIPKVDQCQHDYSFRLDVSDESRLKHNAEFFAEKPYALNMFPTVDKKCDNGFTVSVSNGEISLITLKKSIQRKGYIARLFNCDERQKEANISFGDVTLNLVFGKFEVKTVVFDGKEAFETDEMLI